MQKYLILIHIFAQIFIFGRQVSVIAASDLPPIVLIPGDGGSQLEAKLDKPQVVHSTCDKVTKDFFTLWLDIKKLVLPIAIDCWADNFKMTYDNESKRTLNQPGVVTRIADFGNPSVVEYLDPVARPLAGGYFNEIASTLTSLGYLSNTNLHSAPYDFRKGPSELDIFFVNVTNLIESTYEANGKKRVVILAHSMGAVLSLILMHNKPKAWKNKYIKAFVSLAGAYGGSVKAVKIFAAGDDLGVFIVDQKALKPVLRTLPSSAFLMPNEKLWQDDVIVSTKSMKYRLKDMEQFFKDVDYTTGYQMYLNEKKYIMNLGPPEVEVHCLHGQGVSTIKELFYGSNQFPDDPLFVYEDGDGTVNRRSLDVCKKWITAQKERVHTQAFEGVDHMSILTDQSTLDYIKEKIQEWSQGL